MKHLIFDLKGVLIDYPPTDWHHLIEHQPEHNPFRLLPGVEILKAVYKKIKDTPFNLYILSNFKPERFTLLQKHHPELFEYFDGVVISGSTPYAKPDERIFHHLCNSYGLLPSECVFIDDAAHNVETACQIGMHGIVCDDFERVENELMALGLM